MNLKKSFFYLSLLTLVGLSNCAKKQQMVSASEDLSTIDINEEKNLAEGRVLNGTPTTIEEFPFVVSVRAGGICTGSIINNEWILTAAHCGNGSYILSGSDAGCASGGKSYSVALSVKKGYTGMTNDIILYKLKEKIQFNAKTAPIGFVPEDGLQKGTLSTIIGWAKGNGNGLPDGGGTGGCGRFEYLTAGISTFYKGDNANNSAHVGTSENSSAFRITSQPNSGTRSGDSGGPHFLIKPDGTNIQVGIHSAGDGYQHSYSTRVSSFYDWIMQTTGLTEAIVKQKDNQYTVDASNTTHDGFLSAQAFIIDEKLNRSLEVVVNKVGNIVRFDFSLEAYLALKEWKSENFKIEFRFYYGGTYFTKVLSENFSALQAMTTFLPDDKLIDLAKHNPAEFKKLANFRYLTHQHGTNYWEKNILMDHILQQELKYKWIYQFVDPNKKPTHPSYITIMHLTTPFKKFGEEVDMFVDCSGCKPENIDILEVEAINKNNQIVFKIIP